MSVEDEWMEESSDIKFVGRGKGGEPGEYDKETKNNSKGYKNKSYKIRSNRKNK